ncbi:PGF-CTERM sorting domain-containing protein [Haloarculaceae archaeon H-GB11]|nr:PGF-CTERM sorting domain-containing protein [Haloarculaceae archaeon H-GB11]
MQRERALAVGGVALLVVLLVAAVAVPGALAERDSDVRPSDLYLQDDVAIAPAAVSGETATLSLDVRLAHYGGTAENVTVEVRAIDSDTNLLATTETVDVGNVEGNREVPVRANVTVERAGGYNFQVFVYEDGQRVASGTTQISGVGSLTPEYARSSVTFERFGDVGIPPISYSIAEASDGSATLATQTHLTNTGDETVGDLTLVVMARQAESNIVADRATVSVGDVRPGRTASVDTALTVPDDYNYRLDAILLRDDVVLGTASATAELAPTKPLPKNVTRERVDIRASDFESDAGGDRGETSQPTEYGTAASGPGFGVPVALAALLGVVLLGLRRNQ